MRLPCPSCGALHIDKGEFATKVHHTHACQSCGMAWRPAVVPTVGVQFLPGFKNEPENENEPEPSSIALTIAEYGGIDGAHHKQWVIDQMVRALTGDGYEAWVVRQRDGDDGPDTYEWDEGIAP